MNQENSHILATPLSELKMSQEFMAMSELNHFESLKDMLELPINALLDHPQFTKRLLAEYLHKLTKLGFSNLIED